MKRVLIAGATGYLGKYLVQSFKKERYYIRVLVRNEEKLAKQGPFLEPAVDHLVDDVFIGDVTNPNSLIGVCKGMDVVVSSVGLTRQKGNLTFHDVDYLGNLNLLNEAQKEQIQAFMYIHACQAESFHNPIVDAKNQFVKKLKQSNLNYIIIKPTGYFSDLSEILKMAQQGRVYLVGSGRQKLNPIHGEDLANYCVESITKHNTELEVGGPTTYRHEEIANIAFQTLNQRRQIWHIPQKLIQATFPFLKLFSQRHYALVKFFYDGTNCDVIAPSWGHKNLPSFYQDFINFQKEQTTNEQT
ncbi:MAG: SDR family oxidoreductase [Bacillota bacterium]|nr:SDR family oxidoreductase [Bacillota bacterium]